MSAKPEPAKPLSTPPMRTLLGLDSRVLREHPALLITVAYFCVSLIGMMFSWSLLREFGLDIFEYAEITDFLMAALREPMTFLVAGGGLVTAWILWAWAGLEQRFFARRPPKSWLMRTYRDLSRWSAYSSMPMLTIIALYTYLFISLYADHRADVLRAGGGDRVLVTTQATPDAVQRTLLGTTSRFLLLLDLDGNNVEVLPLEAVIEIETRFEQQDMQLEPAAETQE